MIATDYLTPLMIVLGIVAPGFGAMAAPSRRWLWAVIGLTFFAFGFCVWLMLHALAQPMKSGFEAIIVFYGLLGLGSLGAGLIARWVRQRRHRR